MLEFGKPYVLTFELNIAGTSQRPGVVRAVFSNGQIFMGFNCKQIDEKRYELIANVPLGVFQAEQVMFTIEALMGTQAFTIYKKPIDAQAGFELTPGVSAAAVPAPEPVQALAPPVDEVPSVGREEPSMEPQQFATMPAQEVQVEIEDEEEEEVEEENKEIKQTTYNSGHVSPAKPTKAVDLTIEAYIAPKNLMKSLAEDTFAIPVKESATKKPTKSITRKPKQTDQFSIRKTKLVLI